MAQPTSEPGIALGAPQLAILLDSTQELIAILGPDGTIQFANATFQTVLGYRLEDLLGRSLHAMVHASDVDGVRERLREASKESASAYRNAAGSAVVTVRGNGFSTPSGIRCMRRPWKEFCFTPTM